MDQPTWRMAARRRGACSGRGARAALLRPPVGAARRGVRVRLQPAGLGVDPGDAHAAAAAPRAGELAGLPPRFEITCPLPRQGIHSRGPWDAGA